MTAQGSMRQQKSKASSIALLLISQSALALLACGMLEREEHLGM